MTNSPIKQTVMRRVHAVHTLRPIISGGMLALLVLVAALWQIGREVWVAKVFSNGPHDFFGHMEYLAYAFEHTHLSVEALVLVSLAATIYLARVTAHAFFVSFRLTHATR